MIPARTSWAVFFPAIRKTTTGGPPIFAAPLRKPLTRPTGIVIANVGVRLYRHPLPAEITRIAIKRRMSSASIYASSNAPNGNVSIDAIPSGATDRQLAWRTAVGNRNAIAGISIRVMISTDSNGP